MRLGHSVRTRLLVVVVGLTPFLVGVAASSAATIHACAKKQNGQLRQVAAPGDCGPSEEPLAWSSEGVKTISGLVGLNGEQFLGSGFTVTKLGTGTYRISFPPGPGRRSR